MPTELMSSYYCILEIEDQSKNKFIIATGSKFSEEQLNGFVGCNTNIKFVGDKWEILKVIQVYVTSRYS